jgi:predicted ATP-dependent serine protease
MAYHCKDCSYRGTKSGQMGECLACGSYNTVKRSMTFNEQPPPKKWRLVALFALWGVLITMVIGKLIH